MLGTNVIIESTCRFCSEPIHVETCDCGANLGILQPTGAVVWTGIQYADGCAADSLCTTMAFFCSDGHLNSWRDGQKTKGFRLSMDEGLQMGRAIFVPLLAAAAKKD